MHIQVVLLCDVVHKVIQSCGNSLFRVALRMSSPGTVLCFCQIKIFGLYSLWIFQVLVQLFFEIFCWSLIQPVSTAGYCCSSYSYSLFIAHNELVESCFMILLLRWIWLLHVFDHPLYDHPCMILSHKGPWKDITWFLRNWLERVFYHGLYKRLWGSFNQFFEPSNQR